MKTYKGSSDFGKVKYGAMLGIGSIFAAADANAGIITSSGATTIGAGSTVTLANGVTVSNTQTTSTVSGKTAYTSSISLNSSSGFVTTKLNAGSVIGPGWASASQQFTNVYSVTNGKSTGGQSGSGSGIYGFSFVSGGVTNYGWANITVTDNGKPFLANYQTIIATINSFAYSTAGELIKAGQNVAYVAAVPEAETVAMLASGLGLLGFVAKRRRNTAKQFNANNMVPA